MQRHDFPPSGATRLPARIAGAGAPSVATLVRCRACFRRGQSNLGVSALPRTAIPSRSRLKRHCRRSRDRPVVHSGGRHRRLRLLAAAGVCALGGWRLCRCVAASPGLYRPHKIIVTVKRLTEPSPAAHLVKHRAEHANAITQAAWQKTVVAGAFGRAPAVAAKARQHPAARRAPGPLPPAGNT